MRMDLQFFGGNGSSSGMSTSSRSTGGELVTDGNIIKGVNDNGSSATISKINLNNATISSLQGIAAGLGEPNSISRSRNKEVLLDAISDHGRNIYRVSRSMAGGQGTNPLYASSKSEARNYAKGWLRANK